MDFTSRLETRSKELCNQIDEYLKLIFTGPVQSFGYVHPNFGELMQFYHISREASVVVPNCAELQIAFRKLGQERNTKRTVNQLVPFEVSPRIVLFDNYFCKANDCTVWGSSIGEQALKDFSVCYLPFIQNRIGLDLVSRLGELG